MDLQSAFDAGFDVVKKYVDDMEAAFDARLSAIEKALAEAPVPKDGKDADPEAIATAVLDNIKSDLSEMREAIETIPEAPEAPEMPDIPALVDKAVKAAVGALPAPADGNSVTVDDVLPELKAHLSELVAALPKAEKGSDGIGLAGAFIDRDGELTVTLTNGETRGLGKIVGKDGADGIGFDDIDVVHDGQRSFTFRLQKGAKIIERSFSLPVVLDCGVFKDGTEYQKGDGATYGGSFWIAQDKTTDKPGTSEGWRLAVKKGRDGKDGEMKEAKPQEPVKTK